MLLVRRIILKERKYIAAPTIASKCPNYSVFHLPASQNVLPVAFLQWVFHITQISSWIRTFLLQSMYIALQPCIAIVTQMTACGRVASHHLGTSVTDLTCLLWMLAYIRSDSTRFISLVATHHMTWMHTAVAIPFPVYMSCDTQCGVPARVFYWDLVDLGSNPHLATSDLQPVILFQWDLPHWGVVRMKWK